MHKYVLKTGESHEYSCEIEVKFPIFVLLVEIPNRWKVLFLSGRCLP